MTFPIAILARVEISVSRAHDPIMQRLHLIFTFNDMITYHEVRGERYKTECDRTESSFGLSPLSRPTNRIRGSLTVKSHYSHRYPSSDVSLIQYKPHGECSESSTDSREWNWPFASTSPAHSELCNTSTRCIQSHLYSKRQFATEKIGPWRSSDLT